MLRLTCTETTSLLEVLTHYFFLRAQEDETLTEAVEEGTTVLYPDLADEAEAHDAVISRLFDRLDAALPLRGPSLQVRALERMLGGHATPPGAAGPPIFTC